jgi:hypothetical protein
VHPTSLRRQSRWMGRKAFGSRKPNAGDYARALETTRILAERLGALEVPPSDLLDVSDFSRVTTSPSAQKRLLALRRSRLGPPGPDADEDDSEREAA